MKRIISWLIVIVMAIALLPIKNVKAADPTMITAFTLESEVNFSAPLDGDDILYEESDFVKVKTSTPSGIENQYKISCAWYDQKNKKTL